MISTSYSGELFPYLYFDFWTLDVLDCWRQVPGGIARCIARFYWDELRQDGAYKMVYDEGAFHYG